ncbi:MAG: SDR family NAD(P)-dependent oxidoreductase [Bacilli bacterium]
MNILITGGRGGIALQVAKKLAVYDVTIYLSVHTINQLNTLKKSLCNYKNIKVLKLDVTNNNDVKLIENLRIDILFSNAGIGMGGSIADIPLYLVKENYNVNVFGNFNVVQTVLKGMIERGSGRIIIMSSLLGIAPLKFLGVYSSTKAAIISLTTSLQKEIKLLNKNIRVCLIEPGAYHTGFNQVMLNNKYDYMKKNSFFISKLSSIRKKENRLFNFIEKKNIDNIVNKIVDSIISNNPKKIYRAPFLQVLFIKIYSFIFM